VASPSERPDVVTSRSDRPAVIHEGLPTQLPDIDPEETQEWLDSLNAMVGR
jgi:pyruvate dehydrogenase E1 component